jgi:prepilin-type processing-associated H-X9-DG protein
LAVLSWVFRHILNKTGEIAMKKLWTKMDFKTSKMAFTLVELFVVISIIAMLTGILMPALNGARKASYAIKCAANQKSLGLAMTAYTVDYSYYPASYLYLNSSSGGPVVNWSDQTHSAGYRHWSYYLFSFGKCDKGAFECPAIKNRGLPRTNPGEKSEDWEGGQTDQNGNVGRGQITDQQAPRMAYTANAAMIPGAQRLNKFVSAASVDRPSNVILAAEFYEDWKALLKDREVKSHRPVTVFSDVYGSYDAYDVYRSPAGRLSYTYGSGNPADNFGMQDIDYIKNSPSLIDGAHYQLNVIGRHHPGGADSKTLGGTTNFVYCDGHVARKQLLETLKGAEWGSKFYSMTGNNRVVPTAAGFK